MTLWISDASSTFKYDKYSTWPLAQERIWKLGTREKFLSCPSTFLAVQVQSVVLGSAFVMVSTVWSVSCLPFFCSRCPSVHQFVKVGARVPRTPWSRRHCTWQVYNTTCRQFGSDPTFLNHPIQNNYEALTVSMIERLTCSLGWLIGENWCASRMR